MVGTMPVAARRRARAAEILRLRVVGRVQISPSYCRVILGQGDVDRFHPAGFDQWFRLFLPVDEGSLDRLPARFGPLEHWRFLAISSAHRPIARDFTVRAFRSDGVFGAELDVDVVVHGAHGTGGPATEWAQQCALGDEVAVLDEGITFDPPARLTRLRIVADETGVPAVESILRSLPDSAEGDVLLEVPDIEDCRDLDCPDGVIVDWIVRQEDPPGSVALATASADRLPDEHTYCWVAGEASLTTGLRRHWVHGGVARDAVTVRPFYRAARS